ncbi:CU044_5270 family protein [Micromonospora sp. CPCC 206061]|uniref:CU044_5270 family protein n=1 Tax=Micromonospora sp. CPCC 206061 TaxID=3122410 RepID=UPI002FF1D4E6
MTPDRMPSDELSLLEEFGEPLKPAGTHPPADLRHRVMHAVRRDRSRGRLLPRTATWPAGARLAWRVGAPAAVAATIAAGLIAGNTANVAGNAPAPPPADAGTPTPMGTPAPAGASGVLQLAAQHAEATPPVDARDNQFLYVESMEVRSTSGKDGKARVVGPVRVRTWLSVDGTRDGLVTDDTGARTRLSGCRDGLRAETIDRPDTTPKVPCTPEPAYQHTNVPTDPEKLLAYLYDPRDNRDHYVWLLEPGSRKGRYVKISEHQRAFMKLAELLWQNHSPAVQAAAFRAAARIPGVELRPVVTDAAGRAGAAATRTEIGVREELVFAPQTYAFLGHNSIVAEFHVTGPEHTGQPPGAVDSIRIETDRSRKPGDVVQKWAILSTAIVDRAGQRP